MTEAEWLACADPALMLDVLWDKASERKLRLFACACCRCSRQLLRNKDLRECLEVSGRYADGQATVEELAAAYRRSNGLACNLYSGSTRRETHRWAEATAVANATAVTSQDYPMQSYAKDAAFMIGLAAGWKPNHRLCHLMRDIIGNPYRPAPLIPRHVLGWNDATVRRLAEAIYQEGAYHRLPILADALLDAGCEDDAIVSHCREPGPHVRGCWSIDLLLGKE